MHLAQSSANTFVLRERAGAIALKDYEGMQEYIAAKRSAWASIAAAGNIPVNALGNPVNEDEIIHSILRGLPKEYERFRGDVVVMNLNLNSSMRQVNRLPQRYEPTRET